MEMCVVSKGEVLSTVWGGSGDPFVTWKRDRKKDESTSPALMGTSGTYFSSCYEKTPKKSNPRRRVCSGSDFVATVHYGGESRAKEREQLVTLCHSHESQTADC